MSYDTDKNAIITQEQFYGYEFKKTVSKLSFIKARKNKFEKWIWIVDNDNIDFDEFDYIFEDIHNISYKDVEQLRNILQDIQQNKQPKCLSLKELFSKTKESISFDKKTYIFEGDIHSINNGQYSYYYLLIDNQQIYNSIVIVINKNLLDSIHLHPKELIDKRVIVTGTITITDNLRWQMNAKNIKILGPCSRLLQYEQWKNDCRQLLSIKQPTEYDLSIKLSRIGLISNSSTQGYSDFMRTINNKYISKDNIIQKDIPLNIDNINQAINELNLLDNCQIICIVRGGGDPEDLLRFSDPKLVYTIYRSKIFIVTGIGHYNDQSLSDMIADKDAHTPTGAANYINTIIAKQNKVKRAAKATDLKQLCHEYEEYIEELEEQINELTKKLEQKNNRGLIGRIFNW